MRLRILIILFLVALPAHAARYALRGTVVTPAGVIANGVVVVDGDTIVELAARAPKGVTVIDTGGVIFPGLIDLHNHVTWNAFPRWRPKRAVTARYDWIADPDYLATLSDPRGAVNQSHDCDLERYGEVKALVNGATAIAGSLAKPCSRGLIRNLDYDSGFAGKTPAQYRIFPFQLNAAAEAEVRTALDAGTPVIVHLAEGVGESPRRELSMLNGHGFLKPGLVAIHGVALNAGDFEALKKGGAGLVWSPRSNLELYGTTVDLKSALAAKLTIAISPDWSPSGSAGMIPEMTYAWRWLEGTDVPLTAKDLVEMATVNAATLGGVGDKTGRIETGYAADFVVVAPNGRADPYETLLATQPAGVRLVVVAGRPLYGDAALLTKVNPSAKTEPLTICGAAKAIDMSDSDEGKGVSLAATRSTLQAAMGTIKLSELADCR